MKKIILSSVLLASALLGKNIADASVIKPIRDFTPPPPITPQNTLKAGVENQFDLANRTGYYSVTDKLDNSMDKFHLSAGAFGSSFYSSVLYRYRGANFYTILNLHKTKANDYKDGNGKKVGFGYERDGQTLVVGYLPTDMSEIKFTFLRDNIDDDKQPQHAQDALRTRRYVVRGDVRLGAEDNSNTANFTAIYRDVERKAANFGLRNGNPKVYVDLERKIFDFGGSYDVDFGDLHNTFGVKITRDRHDGDRYTDPKGTGKFLLSAKRFAGVNVNEYKIYDTLKYNINEKNSLALGLDYVINKAKLSKIDDKFLLLGQPPKMISTRDLFKQIYKINVADNIKQNGLSVALRYEFKPNELDSYALNAQSLYRMPGNMERFNSVYGPADNGWITNPLIKPERHNRLKFDGVYKSQNYKGYLNSLSGASYAISGYLIADNVKDLIIYDRRHLKTAMPMNKNAVISRNVDARLYLAKLETELNFAKNYGTKLSAIYSYGENKTDDRPLYQIRPFEINWQLDYRDYFALGSYNLGSNLRYVAKQSRGDWDKSTGLGIDNKKAAKGFSTLDLYGGVEFKNKVGVRLGVNNVFDKNYAEFLSGNHVGALAPNVVNAPGRTFWLSLHASY